MLNKLRGIKERYDQLTHSLSQAEVVSDSEQFRRLSKEHSELSELVQAYEEYSGLQAQLASNQEILEDTGEDPELQEMAQQEMEMLSIQTEKLEDKIKRLLIPKDPNDSRNTILEIRAGTGGEEAALFVYDLFRMYTRYAELKKWRFQIIEQHETDIGGFKAIILAVEGKDVYSRLKFESGVHRVQRIPRTETQGRVHTSAATVAIMPEVEEVEIEINPNDLRIDVYRSSGPGGQSVNTTDSAVRITHLPTGLIVICQNEKSQLKNKNQALKVLRARLHEQETKAQQDSSAEQRKSMVGSGDRSERIRTYNFPQGRITDHRVNLTLYQLESILMGNLDPIIDELLTNHQAELLKQGAS
ncbi:MAG: peptide chain release factor 1 [SAR324 cluster bacterium]|nr:peptide chain release factor 1 [SAR324 cluster bacterium]